jgi:hypothetical protein
VEGQGTARRTEGWGVAHHTDTALAGEGNSPPAGSPCETEESAEPLGTRVLLHRQQSAGGYLVAKALNEGSGDREDRHLTTHATAHPQQPAPDGEQGSGEDPGGPGLEAGDHA